MFFRALEKLLLSLNFMLLSFCFVSSSAVAQSEEIYTPQVLTPWIEWVKQNNPEWQCARSNHAFECVWPGALRYNLSGSGAEFIVSVEMLKEDKLPLPSNAGLYPRHISVSKNGGEIVSSSLSLSEGQLWIKLPKGKFEIKGSFVWNSMPQQLPAPASYGLVEVGLPEQMKNLSTSRGTDSLWLVDKTQNSAKDSLGFSVMRRVSDGSPLSIETLVRVRTSGKSRSIRVPGILPTASEAVTLQSSLPAQLSSDGTLALQLLPGEYEIRILSLMQQPISEISVPLVTVEGWPKEEIWTWQSDLSLRSVELSGGIPIHADLTELPQDWRTGAVYVFSPASKLQLNEIRRGEQSLAPDKISIDRKLWIDLDGKGATVFDNFYGQINKDFRINALAELKAGRATIDGKPAILTIDPESKATGVELRANNLNMQVVSRLDDARSSIYATGWNLVVDRFNLSINLPPSWKLLHVSGASKSINSWVDSWTLLDIFVCILLTLAAFKLFGISIAFILGISLLLNHSEFLAPRMLYIHLLLLTVWRMLTDNKESIWHLMSTALLLITYAAWTLQMLAFAKLQFTEALFPQLEAGMRFRTILQQLAVILEQSIFIWPLVLLVMALFILASRLIFKSRSIGEAVIKSIVYAVALMIVVSVIVQLYGMLPYRSFSVESKQQMAEGSAQPFADSQPLFLEAPAISSNPQDRSTRLLKKERLGAEQAANESFSYQGKSLSSGPALPTWNWKNFKVVVSSPVASDHKLKFYFLDPVSNRLISGLRAIMSLILIALIFRALGFTVSSIIKWTPKSAISAALIAVLVFLPHPAQAENVSNEMLEALKIRLEKKLCNEDQCAVIESAKFSSSASSIKIELEASSYGISYVQIPGPLEVIDPRVVRLNGKDTIAMRRSRDGYLLVRTENGKNIIEIEAGLPDTQAFTVQFLQVPLFTSVDASEWYVEGLNSGGLVQSNLRFVRRSDTNNRINEPLESEKQEFATWVEVFRDFKLGEQPSVQTSIRRIGDYTREGYVRVPLLSAERITSGTAKIENSDILISFPAGVSEQSYSSIIPYSASLEIEARAMPRISERWKFVCQSTISCNFSGLNPTARISEGFQAYQFTPFPGEKIALDIKNLETLQGEFITVDQLLHQIRWGANLLEGSLSATIRVTQQSSFKITAPAEIKIQDVLLDGLPGQSMINGSDSSLLLSPGEHSLKLSYSRDFKPGFNETVPSFSFSAPINNARITVNPSQDRWLLWTGGMAWGPAVVFWIKMLLVVLICWLLFILGVFPGSALGAVLTGMGLATMPLWMIGVPLLWLSALVVAPKMRDQLSKLPRWLRLTVFISLTLIVLGMWYRTVQTGLIFEPPMLIAGNGSSAYSLNWYSDHVDSTLSGPFVISLPIWCWRVVALLWSTWLVLALFGWLQGCIAIIRDNFEKR